MPTSRTAMAAAAASTRRIIRALHTTAGGAGTTAGASCVMSWWSGCLSPVTMLSGRTIVSTVSVSTEM